MTSQPRAVVFGVAQDGGHPQPGCRRDCCRGARVVRHLTTCIAVIDGTKAWLLDAGPDFRQHLALLDLQEAELAGILLTHGHIGHYTGLMYLGRETMDAAALPVWAAPRLVTFLTSNGPWEQLVTAGNIDLRVIEPGNPIQLSDHVRVEAIEVPHRDEYSETVGFQVAGPERSVLYVPDTDGWDDWEPSVEDHIREVDIALLDATFFSHDEHPGRNISEIAHPLVAESLTRFGALDDRDRAKIRFTHLNHSNPLLNPNSDESVAVARSGMSVAQEGDVYSL